MTLKIDPNAILEYMRRSAYRPLTADELADDLHIGRRDREAFKELLNGMEQEGKVVRTRRSRYGVPERMNLVVGRFQGHEKGFGFVLPDDSEAGDVFIAPEDMLGAMHGDRVVARLTGQGTAGRSREGEIIRILKRANHRVVGTFERSKRYAFVVPDEKRLSQDIFVDQENFGDARDGEKVVVEITSWPKGRRNPEGRVVERLGQRGEPGVDVLSIIVKHHLPLEFPPDVLREAERIPETVGEEELAGRLDLRGLTTVTIDGEDARDLDDAVSLEPGSGQARWRLGVHIADVSHYVREGSALDREARERGTSVYLVDRVIPMLPPRLSNGICSLNPQVDRLTVSVFLEFDERGRRVGYDIQPTVIRSTARMTYTDVARIVETRDPETRRRYAGLTETFEAMAELSSLLRARRRDRGSLDFDMPEAKVLLDVEGRPIEVGAAEHNRAHEIIEDFMIAANEAVAEHVFWLQLPFLYRVHEEPDPEKVEAFDEFLFNFRLKLRAGREVHPKAFQQILERISGWKEEQLISNLMLRSMRQARYATENLGHFGLASQFYTHFTSPIRRYPDLMIHRILKEHLQKGRLSAERVAELREMLPGVADHCSERERAAVAAERESVELKMAQYMEDKVGEVYDGIISGVTSFGVFVQLPNLIEGLVHVSNMTDDYYQYHEKHFALIGERTGRTFRIGDAVRVQVVKVNPGERLIDFHFAEEPEGKNGERENGGKGRGRAKKAGGPARAATAGNKKNGSPKKDGRSKKGQPARNQGAADGKPNQQPAGAGKGSRRPRRRRSSKKQTVG